MRKPRTRNPEPGTAELTQRREDAKKGEETTGRKDNAEPESGRAWEHEQNRKTGTAVGTQRRKECRRGDGA